jgi:hypothetical protein
MAATLATLACSTPGTGPTPSASRVIVRNTGSFDAVVYVVRESGAMGARIGNVAANTTRGLAFGLNQVSSAEVLMLVVHPIGTNARWTSAGVTLQRGMVPVLDLPIGAGGDCSVCALRVVSAAAALRMVRADHRVVGPPNANRPIKKQTAFGYGHQRYPNGH